MANVPASQGSQAIPRIHAVSGVSTTVIGNPRPGLARFPPARPAPLVGASPAPGRGAPDLVNRDVRDRVAYRMMPAHRPGSMRGPHFEKASFARG
jgi:hypothetical protein